MLLFVSLTVLLISAAPLALGQADKSCLEVDWAGTDFLARDIPLAAIAAAADVDVQSKSVDVGVRRRDNRHR